jgi:hypothetical protein
MIANMGGADVTEPYTLSELSRERAIRKSLLDSQAHTGNPMRR